MNNIPAKTLLASAVLAATGGHALAQSDNLGLEEIIVTAQKRQESIQSVPIAVTAFDAEALAAWQAAAPDAEIVPIDSGPGPA